jgi:hypothetical protein
VSTPVIEYCAKREGSVWTPDDTAYVADKIRQIDALAQACAILRDMDDIPSLAELRGIPEAGAAA